MTYTTQKTTQLPTNCANCPQFHNYRDNRGGGWCNFYDRFAKEHHPFTHDCKLNYLDSEDILRSEHEAGSLVKLIDSHKDHSQWTTYVVVGKKYNPNRYQNTKTFLNQTDWYYRLATIEKLEVTQQWVAEDEICHYDQADIINPIGEF
ncbi:conserved hypothetical protein [Hyella patelloides LEGE 07179]|uniref:Uncharacterized protein n=1 Tax=Hyella patelloides LEGE 07179 TaxID=945734 RepID=A0A563VYH5_9CYAN|nr:hypothetical protein [Hyella patelloides]VEP16323.1 conserved hypothetical protein [Hyella patelloides LEGE 07179]